MSFKKKVFSFQTSVLSLLHVILSVMKNLPSSYSTVRWKILRPMIGLRMTFCLVSFLLLVTCYLSLVTLTVNADEIEDLQREIDKLNQSRELSVKATKPLEGQLGNLQKQLAQIKANLVTLSENIKTKQKDLEAREEKLVLQHALLETRVRSYYIRSYSSAPLLVILSSDDPGQLFRELAYRLSATKEDRRVITSITHEVEDLLVQKEKLEKDKARLAIIQVDVDKNAKFLDGEIQKAKKYQAELSTQIAQLTAKQQQIIAQRQASLNLPASLGAGPLFCTDDRKLNPGFSPAFAFFTFGIPHRVGMNQYGALGRAQAGQNHEDILRAYFQNFEFSSGKEGETVVVNGTNEFGQSFNNESMNIEEYMKHLHEMPTSWPQEALKAQAIAARSYALRIQKENGRLRPSQADQVIKRELNNGNWIAAVEATRGKVMQEGGQPIKAWFASTSGGYTFTSADVWGGNTGWTKRMRDTNGDVGSLSDLMSKSYDKESPCFYAAQGYRKEYDKSAWLKSEEVADIVNVIMLTKMDSGTSKHLYQEDKPNPEGTDTWSKDRVKQEIRSRGGNPFNSVSDVSMGHDLGTGLTNSVTISGDGGSQTFNGGEFRNFFNLRAPANISIVGPLFNIERK